MKLIAEATAGITTAKPHKFDNAVLAQHPTHEQQILSEHAAEGEA
jgi:predicted NAD/FAD-binding protein